MGLSFPELSNVFLSLYALHSGPRVPLSSDAFSFFGCGPEAPLLDKQVREATRFLIDRVVPKLAAQINNTEVRAVSHKAMVGRLHEAGG